MNGECKSYRLNDPMAWKEFMSMPDDIKITYIKLLRQKFNVPGKHIAMMLGISNCYYSKEINRLGISEGKHSRGRCTPWDKEGFFAWWNGVKQIPTPIPEEIPVEEPTQAEPEAFVEDDLPFEEPEAFCIPLNPNRTDTDKVLTGIHPSQAELELKAKVENEWLRKENDSLRMNIRILEAQMEVVHLIFGGSRNGT